MLFQLTFVTHDHRMHISSSILSLRYTKERYTPYTQISGKVSTSIAFDDIQSILLTCDGNRLHFGPPDIVERQFKDGCYILSFSSRGYTAALGQNQLTPGLHFNIRFSELMQNEVALPNIEYQQYGIALNYVYIKENDSMWDAAKAFARKLLKEHPYIYGANTVTIARMVTPPLKIDESDVIATAIGQDCRHIISHYHMKDLAGEYNTYNLTNDAAVDREMIRHKHIPLDRQWLSDPDEAMQYRFDYSERGSKYTKISYLGYNNEELRQTVTCNTSDVSVTMREISRIDLNVTPKGAITTLWFYTDSYTEA